MIEGKTFYYCENCHKQILDTSPPTDEQYENAQICIQDGTILLPEAVVAKNHKPGVADYYTEYITGYYCCPECLIKKINKILRRRIK